MIEHPYKGKLFAVLCDGAICGIHVGAAWMPLVFLDPEKMQPMRILSQTVANLCGKPVCIYEFAKGCIIETIQPKGQKFGAGLSPQAAAPDPATRHKP